MQAPHSDVFFDRSRLRRYLQELGLAPSEVDKEVVAQLLTELDGQRLMTSDRPHSLEDELYGPAVKTFVNNSLLATQVSFQHQSYSSSVPNPIRIWISDPDALAGGRNPALNEGAREGSFIYLVEEHWREDAVASYERTERSCLDWLIDELVNAGAVGQKQRDKTTAHQAPTEKLKKLGGVLSAPRHINCLYRKSRISANVVIESEGRKFGFFGSKGVRNFNDVVGHPILIGSV